MQEGAVVVTGEVDGGGAARAAAAALVDGLLTRVRAQQAAVEAQRTDLSRAACATWESTAARAYRDGLDRLLVRARGVEEDLHGLADHLARLAEDLRTGRAGDLVVREEQNAAAIIKGYAAGRP